MVCRCSRISAALVAPSLAGSRSSPERGRAAFRTRLGSCSALGNTRANSAASIVQGFPGSERDADNVPAAIARMIVMRDLPTTRAASVTLKSIAEHPPDRGRPLFRSCAAHDRNSMVLGGTSRDNRRAPARLQLAAELPAAQSGLCRHFLLAQRAATERRFEINRCSPSLSRHDADLPVVLDDSDEPCQYQR